MATTPEMQLVLAYRRLRADIGVMLQQAKARGLSTRYLEAQLKQVNKAIKLAEAAEVDFQAGMASEYIKSAGAAHATLEAAGVQLKAAAFTGLDQAAVRALQGGLAQRLSDTRAALTLGLGLGDVRTATKEIQKVLDGGSDLVKVVGGVPKVFTPAGEYWDPEKYSKMLARTAIADSRRVSFSQRYLQNGIDVVKVVANGSKHPACRVWEGVSLSLTGATPGYPTVDEARAAGLFHPNCRHRYVVDRDALQGEVPEGPLVPQAPAPSKQPKAKKPAPRIPVPNIPAPTAAASRRALPKVADSLDVGTFAEEGGEPAPRIPEPNISEPSEIPPPRTPAPKQR